MVLLCKYCNKEYSSQSSRSNHIKRYHIESQSKVSICTPTVSISNPYPCRFCDKSYFHKQSRFTHEKKCNGQNNNINIKKLKKENEEIKKEVSELKKLLQKSLKIHPKTLNKINNQLNNTNNGTINNNYIQLGHENLDDILSKKDKLTILNKKGNSLKELIDLVHISDEYKQFKNVYITNLQNTIGYKFDQKNNKFIAVNKSDLLDDIIECRMLDIQTFYDELGDNFNDETKEIIERFIERMGNNEDSLKQINKDEIKLLLYNARDKIKNEDIIEV
jgi:hypothetical protein